ncbi:hypothetical protein AYJ54_05340 [Bradyrhizobium centrolobii]|uniref:PAC domain-containing protein n=1 Tax=Bradyrhizobium centrolobii TaxID=1505087 RepID=A0A176Z7A4_9BRAD|nr:hypothetical protein AYJ54_05340 [Bradyrhizobium centrolobii]
MAGVPSDAPSAPSEARLVANSRQPNSRGSAKGGREIWIEASYIPVLDGSGKTVKAVKIATNIAAKKIRSLPDRSNLSGLISTRRQSRSTAAAPTSLNRVANGRLERQTRDGPYAGNSHSTLANIVL